VTVTAHVVGNDQDRVGRNFVAGRVDEIDHG
jgi:hypothetical protein